MIKEAIEKILGLAEPHYTEYNGMLLCDKTMHEVQSEASPVKRPAPPQLGVKTLSGLVDLLKSEECRRWPMIYVMVQGPAEVVVTTSPREDETRVDLFKATAVLPPITYGQFIDHESMLIMLRSRFVQTPDCETLLQLIGNIKEEAVRTMADDGVSQQVVAKSGIGTVGNVTVNPIQKLQPYRTFLEVEQPVSEFLLRLQPGKQQGQGPTMAVFEADGGAWRNEATENVAGHLLVALDGLPNIRVVR